MESVEPLQGIAPWLGGKRNLAKRLVAIIQSLEHTCYAEPFIGMGGVFFRRTVRARAEVINDRSADVANVFKVLQRHREPLIEAIAAFPAMRAEFDRQLRVDPTTLTDIERAARFIYLQYNRYGGKPDSRSFRTSTHMRAQFTRSRVVDLLGRLSRRLDHVVIEQLDFEAFISRYNRPHTLFYLDPPYVDREDWYGPDLFEPADQERLVETLARVAGPFVLSINDCPRARQLFGRWNLQQVEVNYPISAHLHRGGFPELIVTNR